MTVNLIDKLFTKKKKYEIAHDNLNDIWLLVDASKRYKFYSRIDKQFVRDQRTSPRQSF